GGRRHRRRAVAYRIAANPERRADIGSRGGGGGRTARLVRRNRAPLSRVISSLPRTQWPVAACGRARRHGLLTRTTRRANFEFGIPYSKWATGMIPLDPLPNLIDQVYARILEAITDRSLPPGHRIRQSELAERLGVSRQP